MTSKSAIFFLPSALLPLHETFRNWAICTIGCCVFAGLLIPYIVFQRLLTSWELLKGQDHSVTALIVLQARYLLHVTGYRLDLISAKLWRNSSICPPSFLEYPFSLVLWFLTTFLMGKPKTVNQLCPVNFDLLQVNVRRYQTRSVFYDTFLQSSAPVGQLLLFGAGFDSRSFDVKTNGQAERVYEIDKSSTQRLKKELLAKCENGLTIAQGSVSFIECDFDEEDPWKKLTQSSPFVRGQPFVALWEGVTMYLTEATVVSFLKSAALSMEGNPSAYLLFDYIVFEDQSAANMTSNSFGSQVRLKEKWTCYLPRDIQNWMKINNIYGLKVVDWNCVNGSAVVLLAVSK